MDEQKEFVFGLAESKVEKLTRMKRMNTITNFIVFFIFLLILFYLVTNLETLKLAGSDVCKICYEQTKEQCEGINNCYNAYFKPKLIYEIGNKTDKENLFEIINLTKLNISFK